jgi:NADH dehydrogenase (ubiquinone) Fe-S protein 3
MFYFINNLIKILPISSILLKKNDLSISVEFFNIVYILKFFKNHENLRFDTLIDICCVDYPNFNKRFEIVYNLLSIQYNQRVRIKTYVNEMSSLYSIAYIFKGASWFEREIWDLFGVFFFKHPDLRRILTDYGFNGFPLRKDFPLVGFLEVSYSDKIKSIKFSKIENLQEFRNFNYKINPWY